MSADSFLPDGHGPLLQALLLECRKLDDAIYPTTPVRQKEPKIGFQFSGAK